MTTCGQRSVWRACGLYEVMSMACIIVDFDSRWNVARSTQLGHMG